MKCSYCHKEISDIAVLAVDFLIMPTLEQENGVRVKNEMGIFRNKIACRECVGRIAKEEIEM